MRLLSRNKRPCYYALYMGKTPILDDSGRVTGSYKIEYAAPTLLRANISSAKGESTLRQFGEDLAYDKTIAAPVSLPIDEYTVWWIDKMPELDAKGETVLDAEGNPSVPWDYVTRKVAPSINSSLIAVKKVVHNG